ncbi:ABC transporter permease [Anaerostipes sp.]|uniref:ABC transporter permease n=1 Tax=Anaerostipes sp. TaxID=1872530 RepID=UPI0025BC3542|nr:ABC transporter permease [Anaerostipes sp.]MBS7008269.1 ABC transporter permease [Anaerostipes sp.]
MLNLIRADVYKLLKSTSFRVCGVLFLLLAGSENFLYHLIEKMGGGLGGQMTVISRIQTSDTSYLVLLSIVVSLFIGSEYTYGTIKNLASKQYERSKIFASKWLVSIVLATIYFVLSLVIVGVTAALYWETGDVGGTVISETAGYLFTKYILVLSITSLYVMAAFLIRKTQFILPVAIIGLDVIGTVALYGDMGLTKLIGRPVELAQYWPGNMLSSLVQSGVKHADLTAGILTGMVFLAAAAVIGALHFKAADIK